MLYSKIHAAATEPVCVYSPVVEDSGFAIPSAAASKTIGGVGLDMAKFTTLQADTERVTSILSAIFTQQEVEAESPQDNIGFEHDEDHSQTNIRAVLWGLPQDLSDFVRVLSEKPSWNRDELDELRKTVDLCLRESWSKLTRRHLISLITPIPRMVRYY